MPVVVVTDSSARLPADLAASYGIQVVPLHILVDGADLARILAELKRRGARYGVGSACIGGGQGIAVIIEAL